jgi:hypothetical protein
MSARRQKDTLHTFILRCCEDISRSIYIDPFSLIHLSLRMQSGVCNTG